MSATIAVRRPGRFDAARIPGVDVARGLAVLGMLGAHLGTADEPLALGDPSTWDDVVNGRSSILFATLAGVSIALISGGDRPHEGVVLRRDRVIVAVRGAAVVVIGLALELLQTGVAVILPTYGVLFLVAALMLGARPAVLAVAAAVVALVAPVALWALDQALADGATGVFGHYPAPLWIAFVLAGMALGRLALRRPAVAAAVGGAGLVLAVVGYGSGVLLASSLGVAANSAERAPGLGALATIDAHSGSPFEAIGSLGVALAVLAAALLVTRSRAGRVVLFPLAALGRMALTAYTAQLVAIALLIGSTRNGNDDGLWLGFAVVALVASTLWTLLVGRGPLEAALARIARRAADSLVPPAGGPRTPSPLAS